MPSLEDRVERLEAQLQVATDRATIIELTGRYCQAVANEDMEALLRLFTDEAGLETSFPEGSGREDTSVQGISALREAYQGTAGMSLSP